MSSTSSPVFRIGTDLEDRPTDGLDAMIVSAPDDIYITIGRTRGLSMPALLYLLRDLSRRGAADVGAVLHHADWVLTRDPDEVQRLGMTHDCPTCVAGTDQALTHLRTYPDRDLLIGTLYWAGPERTQP